MVGARLAVIHHPLHRDALQERPVGVVLLAVGLNTRQAARTVWHWHSSVEQGNFVL